MKGNKIMAETKILKAGEILFNEGEYEMCMYDIISGEIGVYADYGKEDEKLLTVLSDGKFVGEVGLLDSMPRSATAVALKDSEIATVTADNISEYFQNDPSKIVDIFKNISARLREMSDEYVEACQTISAYVAEENPSESLGSKIKKLLGGRK